MIQSREQNFKISNLQTKEDRQISFIQKGWKLKKVFCQKIETNWQPGVNFWCFIFPTQTYRIRHGKK